MWFFECVLFNSLYLSIDHWHALPCYVPLIHLCCSLEWKEITKEFPCLSEFLCICGLFSLLISSMYMILLKILNTNFFFFFTNNKQKQNSCGRGCKPLGWSPASWRLATFSSQCWAEKAEVVRLCADQLSWPLLPHS